MNVRWVETLIEEDNDSSEGAKEPPVQPPPEPERKTPPIGPPNRDPKPEPIHDPPMPPPPGTDPKDEPVPIGDPPDRSDQPMAFMTAGFTIGWLADYSRYRARVSLIKKVTTGSVTFLNYVKGVFHDYFEMGGHFFCYCAHRRGIWFLRNC